MFKQIILTALIMFGMMSVFGNGLEISQMNATHAQLSAVNETNILISANFSAPIRISPNFIPLLNGAQAIEIYAEKTKPFSEIGYIAAKSDNSTSSAQFNLTVPRNLSFSISQDSINITADAKGIGSARFYMENTGNADINITANSSGNLSQSLTFTKSVKLENARILYEVNYTAPNATGMYDAVLNFSAESFTKSVKLLMNVVDSAPPKILNYTIPEKMDIMKKYTLSVKAEDNINISEIKIKIEDFVQIANFSNNAYFAEFTPKKFGFFTAEITAYDGFNNTDKAIQQIEIIPINATELFKIRNKIDFGIKSFNSSLNNQKIFLYAENINITLNKTAFLLENMIYKSENSSIYPQVMLLYGADSIDFANFSSLSLTDFSGGIGVEIIPNNYTFAFSGSLQITLPEQYEYVKILEFKGAFKNYTVCAAKTFDLFKYPLSFRPTDTGVYETSRCLGTMEYPIDFNTNDTLVAVSPSEREQIFRQQSEQILFWKSQAGANFTYFLIMVGIGASILAALVFFRLVYPKMGI